MWDVGGAGRLLNEQVYSGHPHLQHFHCNMTNVLDLDLAQLSCIWGIWSCIDELNWVTAESALVKVRWKGVKWRTSTWASWPLSGREDMERDQKGEPAEIWFVRSCISKLQGWVSEVFSLAWNPVIKTLHPVSDLLYLQYYLIYLPCTWCHRVLCHVNSSFQIFRKCEIAPSPGEVCAKYILCQHIPVTISALSSTRIWKKHCELLHAPCPIDFFPC